MSIFFKPYTILLAMILMSCTDAMVPPRAMEAFVKKYPSIKNKKWSRDSHGNFEAAFKQEGVKHRADFDYSSGAWIETEVSIKYENLPLAVKQVIQRKYTQHPISEIEKVDHHSKGLFYDVEFKTKGKNLDLEFNEAGELIGFEN